MTGEDYAAYRCTPPPKMIVQGFALTAIVLHVSRATYQFLFRDSAPMRSLHDDEAGQGGAPSAADTRHWYESDAGQARLAQATEHFRLGHIATANGNGATDRVDGAESGTDD